MKRLLFDHVRRWAWLYLILGLFQLLMLYLANTYDPRSMDIPAFGLLPLMIMLSTGTTRVYHSLPVTKKSIHKFYWVIGVAIPAGIYAGILTFVGLLRLRPGSNGPISISQGTLSMVLCFIWLGAIFQILMKSRSSSLSSNNPYRILLWPLFWLVGLFFGGYIITILPPGWESLKPLDWVAILIGGILTMVGWSPPTSEKKTITPYPKSGEHLLKPQKAFQTLPVQGSGLATLAKMLAKQAIHILLFAIGSAFIFCYLHKETYLSWNVVIINELKYPTCTITTVYLPCMLGTYWLSTLRHFRILPIRGAWLVVLMGAIFLAPTICGLLILSGSALLLSPKANPIEWIQVGTLETAFVLLFVTAILRFGNNIKTYCLLIPFLVICGGLEIYLVTHSLAGTFAFTALLCITGCLLLKNGLLVSAQTYRHKHTVGVP